VEITTDRRQYAAVDANASASSTTETASDDSVAKSQAFFDVRRTGKLA
jgi:hypothetical protein